MVDTNCDPTDITYPIPGNDDAIRAISLFVEIIANAVIDADNEQGIQIVESLDDEDTEAVPAADTKEEADTVYDSTNATDLSKFEPEEEKTEDDAASKEADVDDDKLYDKE